MISAAILREERDSLTFTFRVRLAALAAIATWLCIIIEWPRVTWWLGLIVLFGISGYLPFALRERATLRTWLMLCVLLDAALLTLALLMQNPLGENYWPPQMQLRFNNQLYLFLFLAGAALTYSPKLVLWSGLAVAATWSVGVMVLMGLPGSISQPPPPIPGDEAATQALILENFLSPTYISRLAWQNEVALTLIVSMVIAAAVWRSRQLLRRQVVSERARSNLARYFSPDIVQSLASDSSPLERGEGREMAVLFVDIVGFTGMSESLPPEQTIALLKGFHRRMSESIFANQGTLDKFLGDGVMATFGTLGEGPRDAGNALACATAMMDLVARWNEKRRARGADPVKIGIGLHYGRVVAGNVGGDRQLEFTIIGDAVNCASRIERLTRDLATPLLVSDALLQKAQGEGSVPATVLAQLEPAGSLPLRGRREGIKLWRWRSEGPTPIDVPSA